MNPNDKLDVIREREFSLHHSLLGAAHMALENAEEKRRGWGYSNLTCITLSALALEAIANAFLKEIIQEWKDFEQVSIKAKVRLVAEKLSIDVNFGHVPWCNVIWLSKLRNKIVHAKPERVSKQFVWTRDEYDRNKGKPLSKLEEELTLENAKKAYSTAEEIKDVFCDALPAERQFGLRGDAWEGTASFINGG